MAQRSQRRAGWAGVACADLTGKNRNPSRLMANGAIRIGSRNALLPGKYKRAGMTVWLIINHSGKPQPGALVALATGTLAGAGSGFLAGAKITLCMGFSNRVRVPGFVETKNATAWMNYLSCHDSYQRF